MTRLRLYDRASSLLPSGMVNHQDACLVLQWTKSGGTGNCAEIGYTYKRNKRIGTPAKKID